MFDPWGNPHPGPSGSVPGSEPPMYAAAVGGHSQSDPWGVPNQQPPMTGGFGGLSSQPPVVAADPWAPAPPVVAPPVVDPWAAPVQPPVVPASQPMFAPVVPPLYQQPVIPQKSGGSDPWGLPEASQPAPLVDPFAPQPSAGGNATLDLLNEPSGGSLFGAGSVGTPPTEPKHNTASNFLSNGSHLVNVDNILASSTVQAGGGGGGNPFASLGGGVGGGAGAMNTNPFLQDKPKAKSINEMRNAKTTMFVGGGGGVGGSGGVGMGVPPQPHYPSNDILLPTPIAPTGVNSSSAAGGGSHNPFL